MKPPTTPPDKASTSLVRVPTPVFEQLKAVSMSIGSRPHAIVDRLIGLFLKEINSDPIELARFMSGATQLTMKPSVK